MEEAKVGSDTMMFSDWYHSERDAMGMLMNVCEGKCVKKAVSN